MPGVRSQRKIHSKGIQTSYVDHSSSTKRMLDQQKRRLASASFWVSEAQAYLVKSTARFHPIQQMANIENINVSRLTKSAHLFFHRKSSSSSIGKLSGVTGNFGRS